MQVDLDKIKDIIQLAEEGYFSPKDPWLKTRRDNYTMLVGHPTPYYEAFYGIAQTFKPAFSVELGAYRANAAAHLAIGNPKGLVYTVDVHTIHPTDTTAQALSIEAASRYPNLEYINGWTWDAHVVFQIEAVAAHTPIDLLFIDAGHEYQDAMREWTIYNTMLAEEALVVGDDIFDAAGATVEMARFWKEISEGYDNFLDTVGHSGIPMGYMRFIR